MILYRKVPQLRVRRTWAPEPPFWNATSVAPYSARRATPIAIDYLAAIASGAERLEVTVTSDVRDELERARTLHGPVLIDAADGAEVVFRRGIAVQQWCKEQHLPALFLASSAEAVPESGAVVFAAWPPDPNAFVARRDWGVAVPVLYPRTTDLAVLEALADAAQRNGASFFAALPMEVEPTAKQAMAQEMGLAGDDDRYAMLFHSDIAPIHLATERHIAALAAERGLADFVVPPGWDERTNWNAAVLLTRTAARMLGMELDLDLAGTIARSARTIAELDKPLTRIAESASISIVTGVDDTSVEMLEQWLESGSASFADYVDEQWRLRRA